MDAIMATSDETVPDAALAGANPADTMRWIVPGFVGEGLSILAGRQKVGKTWLAMDWAIAVASGGAAAGAIACDAGDVLYVDAENGSRRIQARLAALSRGRPGPSRLNWLHAPPPVTGIAEALDVWRAAMPEPRLVVIDAAHRFAPAAGPARLLTRAQYERDTYELNDLQRWAIEHALAVLVLARTRKGGADVAANRVFGAADATLVLDRKGRVTTLQVRGRDVGERHAALGFDAGRWSIVGEARELTRSLQRSKIIAVLETSAVAMGPTDVAGALGMPVANVKKMLFRMARTGDVERLGRGLYLLPEAGAGQTVFVPTVPFRWNGFGNSRIAAIPRGPGVAIERSPGPQRPLAVPSLKHGASASQLPPAPVRARIFPTTGRSNPL